jgi:hypothetical protein
MNPRSYKVEVIADSSGEWCGNGLRFPSQESAKWYAINLASRWTLVTATRVVETSEPVTELESDTDHCFRVD